MDKQILLIKVNPDRWKWDDEPNSWDDIGNRAHVSFDGSCKNQKDIQNIKLHDIFVGYNMNHLHNRSNRNKAIVCAGRIISDGCFGSVGLEDDDNKRFLVQKVITLRVPISREWMKNNNITLGINQHTVTGLSLNDWDAIKAQILLHEPEHKDKIDRMETGSDDLWL